ncbi:hypothetical protein [Megavirus chiliensis]|uniref:Uncharacterized protein n=2 Tax=Megamimivirinae TaxID=3044648 RepID=A0A2L2DP22_MIMIV|nr:hypothetical protein MegaChil _gp1066 [Megavirus chiliensis]AEQ33245.1 hypothetical protein [Megavirus chiliensis]AVG47902.1 hypothetical protein [Acanthamoeba polyphaga mimivirus]
MSDRPINLHLPGVTTPSNLQATFLAGGTVGHLTSYSGSASYHKDFSSGAFAGGSGSYSGISGYGSSMGGGQINAYVGYNFFHNK